VLDEFGHASLSEHSIADVSGIRGNWMRKAVRWVGGTSINTLAGEKIVLRVYMTDAKLYSATFRCSS
jgi:hypothetical protein